MRPADRRISGDAQVAAAGLPVSAAHGLFEGPDSGDPSAEPVWLAGGWFDQDAEPDYHTPHETVLATIPVGEHAGDIVVGPDSSRVYVARSDSIAVLSALHHIVGVIRTPAYPRDLAVDADGRWLLAGNDDGSVAVVDLAHRRAGVLQGAVCVRAVHTAAGVLLYAAHNATFGGRCVNWISVFDAAGIRVAVVPGAGDHTITGLAAHPDGTRVYAGLCRRSAYDQHDAGVVSVIDTATHSVIGAVDTGASPDTMTFSPDGSMMYATHHDGGFVSAVDLAAHRVTPIALGDSPLAVSVTPDGSQVYVVNRCSLSVIDTVGNDVSRIAVGELPRCVRIRPDGKRAYVSNFGGRTVSVIDTIDRRVTDVIDVGGHPEALAISPDGERLYVGDYWSGTVTAVGLG